MKVSMRSCSKNTDENLLYNYRRVREKIDIRLLKALVFANYSKDSALFDVIETEEDFLDVIDFCVKVGVWLKLSRRSKN